MTRAILLGAGLVLALATAGECFDLLDGDQPPHRYVMNLQLLPRTQFTTVGYGTQSWNSLATLALGRWNEVGVGPYKDHAFFSATSQDVDDDTCAASMVNQVIFTPVICGFSLGDSLAITVTRHPQAAVRDADVYVNTCFPMNAYPGPLMESVTPDCRGRRSLLFDIFRLLLHEFGHVAGLGHPDEAGQVVVALMNGPSDAGNPPTGLTIDDITGACFVEWRPPGGSVKEAFIRNVYTTILGRAPAQAEVDGWARFLCANPSSGVTLLRGFYQSSEFTRTRQMTLDEYISVLYETALVRAPAADEIAAWRAVVLERFNRLVPGFFNSPEFQAVLRAEPASAVIDRFYLNVLGRAPEPDGAAAWVAYVTATGDWGTVAQGFLNSPEYLGGRRTMAAHVDVLYRTFLGRAPSAAEVDVWLGALFRQLADVEAGFAGTPEFQARFAAAF